MQRCHYSEKTQSDMQFDKKKLHIRVFLTYAQLVRIIKTRQNRILVLYKGRTPAKTLRVILFQKDSYYLNRRSPNKGILDSKRHSFR